MTLRQARYEAGLKQYELAEATGVDPDLIGRLERGERRPTPRVYRALSEVLGVPGIELWPDLFKRFEELEARKS
jgi:transcriptional regulator with XRE-family HTH domain